MDAADLCTEKTRCDEDDTEDDAEQTAPHAAFGSYATETFGHMKTKIH